MALWLGRAWKVAIVAGLIALFIWLNRTIPGQHLPWKELDPDAPIGLATRTQLLRVSISPNATCATLARESEGLASIPADPKAAPDPCGWDVARVVSGVDQITLAGESNMQCPLALGVRIWLGEADRIAQKELGQPLAKIHHFGTYSCRRQYGANSGPWSEHAFANAWDVASFELADGSLISVLRDWKGERAKRRFLRKTRDAACDIFRVTLSPDYNAAHADHFHLDMGPGSSCR